MISQFDELRLYPVVQAVQTEAEEQVLHMLKQFVHTLPDMYWFERHEQVWVFVSKK